MVQNWGARLSSFEKSGITSIGTTLLMFLFAAIMAGLRLGIGTSHFSLLKCSLWQWSFLFLRRDADNGVFGRGSLETIDLAVWKQ